MALRYKLEASPLGPNVLVKATATCDLLGCLCERTFTLSGEMDSKGALQSIESETKNEALKVISAKKLAEELDGQEGVLYDPDADKPGKLSDGELAEG